MAYEFFGAFADLHPDLAREFLRRWPDARIVELTEPFHGLAIRFDEDIWRDADLELPDAVTAVVHEISCQFPDVRIVLLRTECFGGPCENWGQCIRNGRVIMNEPYVDYPECKGALRRLIGNFDVDIGEREIFEPLSRGFPWDGSGC